MLTHYVQSLQGVEWLGIVMILLAVSSFVLMIVWALRLPAAEVDRYGRLPLEPEQPAKEGRS